MKLVGAFFDFARRVMDATEKGGLPRNDKVKLKHLLDRTGKRYTILAKGLLSSLDLEGGHNKTDKNDSQKLAQLLERANERIFHEKEPFTKKEQEEIADIFKKAYVSRKTERWFELQLDELLAEEMHEYLTGRKTLRTNIPTKKVVRMKPADESDVRIEKPKVKA
jgi:hypothetical protein